MLTQLCSVNAHSMLGHFQPMLTNCAHQLCSLVVLTRSQNTQGHRPRERRVRGVVGVCACFGQPVTRSRVCVSVCVCVRVHVRVRVCFGAGTREGVGAGGVVERPGRPR